MTLLGGIFAKRDKQNRGRSAPANLNAPASATSAASISSTIVSSEPDYVFPDKSLSLPGTIYTGPAAASSSKLKLPFRRKYHHQPHAAGSQPGIISLNDGQRISGVVSESGHDLPLPPPKSSIFAMYHDRHTNSSPSLSNESTLPYSLSDTTSTISVAHNEPHTASLSTQLFPPLNKKSGGLFSWARERTKSKPSQPPATIAALSTPTSAPGENFNLRAFRHVRSESPAPPAHQLDPDLPLPPARPRPRGDSVASDSSQRISVAAFREAQARRSCANSPVPSFRPPSTDTLGIENNARKRASTVSTPTANEFLLSPHRSSTAPQLSIRTSRNSSVVDTESDESEDDDDEEVDSDGAPIKPSRKTTVTRRSGPRSRSDAGHIVPNVQAQRSDPRWSKSDSMQLRQPDNDNAAAVRARASASTSALTPNDAARRASILAAANASSVTLGTHPGSHCPYAPNTLFLASEKPLPSRAANDDDSDTSHSSNSDSEDMPLSALVAPRRPGSSASVSTAASRPRMPAKPLIDIKSLVGSPPILKPVLRHEHSVKVSSNKGKEREVDKDEPFAPPPVISLTPSRLTGIPTSVTPYSSASSGPPMHHKKSSSDVGSVPRMSSEPLPDPDDDLMTAIKLVTSFDKARETSPSPTQTSQKMPPPHPAPLPAVQRVDNEELLHDDRIVPTPVREYKPPAAFSVTSRPQRPYSADISQLSSPTSPTATFSSVAKSSPFPQASSLPIKSLFAPRSRAATLAQQPDAPSHDRSDSSSVVSTSQSSHSSRLPRVPLINAVPDSPSVKASWGSSKDLYKHKARAPSAPSLADNRVSRPPSSIRVSLAPSTPRMHMSATAPQSQMLMPSRPFAGNTNSSMRGQSPAGSSTGDSSSGRGAPFTPRDGSDLGVNTGRRDGSDADSTLKARGANARRSTVSFEDDPPQRGRERVKNDADDEGRRNERRRNEAKAAIEVRVFFLYV